MADAEEVRFWANASCGDAGMEGAVALTLGGCPWRSLLGRASRHLSQPFQAMRRTLIGRGIPSTCIIEPRTSTLGRYL